MTLEKTRNLLEILKKIVTLSPVQGFYLVLSLDALTPLINPVVGFS